MCQLPSPLKPRATQPTVIFTVHAKDKPAQYKTDGQTMNSATTNKSAGAVPFHADAENHSVKYLE